LRTGQPAAGPEWKSPIAPVYRANEGLQSNLRPAWWGVNAKESALSLIIDILFNIH
jgi:hypothetical protein